MTRYLNSSLPGKRSLFSKILNIALTLALTFGPAGLAARVLGVVGKGHFGMF